MAESFLIPVLDRRDHVWDSSRQILYITTSTGWIERFDLPNRAFLAPWLVGVSLNGADILPDGSALYVAEGARGATQGLLRKVDLDSGTVTNISYDLDSGEAGAWDVQIANTGRGLVTTQYGGSGWVPLRELDVVSDSLIVRNDPPSSGGGGEVRQNTLISRGSDRSLFLLAEANISSGPMFTYDADSDTFPSQFDTGLFLADALSAVSRTGTFIALEFGGFISILDPALNTVEIVAADSGVVFHPTADLLFAGDSDRNEILVFDSTTWDIEGRLVLGAELEDSTAFGMGVMSATHDGSHIFVSTGSGVQALEAALDIFADGFESGDTSAWSPPDP